MITCTLFVLVSCVSGAPRLTDDQQVRLANIQLFKAGNEPKQSVKLLGEISGADCSAAPYGGRVWGTSQGAVEVLKAKAAAMNADAVVEITCYSIPFLNNCWVAMKCNGSAAKFE